MNTTRHPSWLSGAQHPLRYRENVRTGRTSSARRRGVVLIIAAVVTASTTGCTSGADSASSSGPTTTVVIGPPSPEGTTPAPGSAAPIPVGLTQVQRMLAKSVAQLGDEYVFGIDVDDDDPDPHQWDAGEFTTWSAHQVGSELPGSSFEQYLDLKDRSLLVPVDEAVKTPGALLFHFSEEPQQGDGRPDEAEAAISLGGGAAITALNEDAGVVVVNDAADRYEYGALLPDVRYAGRPSPTR